MYGRKMPAIGKLPPTEPLEGQLYSASPDDVAVISELRRLNRDTLSAYLALLHKMQEAPTAAGAEFAQVRTLLLNVQHLLNSLRPFEAREELIAAVQAQVDGKRRLIEELRSACEAAAIEEEPAPMEEEIVAPQLGPSEAEAAARATLEKLARS